MSPLFLFFFLSFTNFRLGLFLMWGTVVGTWDLDLGLRRLFELSIRTLCELSIHIVIGALHCEYLIL